MRAAIRRAVVPAAAGTLITALTLLYAGAVWSYMTEYPAHRALAVSIGLAGAGIGFVVGRRVDATRPPLVRRSIGLACALIVLALAASRIYGRITYARFGLTVYGAVPIPVLDVVISPSGALSFRDKSHSVARDELRRLLDDDPEVVIVGIGWNETAHVDAKDAIPSGVELLVLESGQAVAAHRNLVRRGKRAALLLHTTC